ncbi:MAG: shikimate kinase [Gammaproteobacteria bacterium]|nr:shikimate kinase [Gammaproteobacteria bacterium]
MRPSKSNVYLIGPMGVGKTTVGSKLAQLIGFEFLDTDHELEQRTGVTVAHIFELEGEDGFRSRETRLLEEIAKCNDRVVATGGGAVLYDSNRKTIRESGKVMYLTASLEFLWDRVRQSTHRPLLHTEDPYSTLKEIHRQRDPIYRGVADHVIEISPTSEKTASRIAEWLNTQDCQ